MLLRIDPNLFEIAKQPAVPGLLLAALIALAMKRARALNRVYVLLAAREPFIGRVAPRAK